MSLSFSENKDSLKSYIKLEIHESQICPEMNVPLPYGINISLGNLQEKNIEPINKEKELFQTPINQFIYYFDKNNFDYNNLLDKEIIINSYTTSIFILKKNFASVKIPFSLNKNEIIKKQWYNLKDINNKVCIKLLLSLYINISNNHTREIQFELTKDILYNNNKTINENKKFYISRANTNYLLNNHNNYLISTNYNSSNGNSLLTLTNNIYNVNNNLNTSLPINLSPITFVGKTNSFFIESKNKQMENNLNIINNNLLYQIKTNEENNLIKNEEDSIIVNDNEIAEVEENNNKIDGIKKEENNINNLINKKINQLDKNLSLNDFNKENYFKIKKDITKNTQTLEKEKTQYRNRIKYLEKSKEKCELKIIKLTENLQLTEECEYRKNLQKELDNYEKSFFQNINFISNINNNLDKLLFTKRKDKKKINNLTPKKAESFNHINIIEKEKNKIKKGITSLNKTIPHNPLFIKKINFQNKKEKLCNINSGREINNKRETPINYKFKKFNRKLSTSTSNISNSENDIKNTYLKTEGKEKRKSINNGSINVSKFKKIDKINTKRKSLKINGNLKIPFNEIINNKKNDSCTNYLNKYSFVKINLNKIKKNSTITNNKKYSDCNINKSNLPKIKTIETDTNIKKYKRPNYFHKISLITVDKNFLSIENISPNNNNVNKTALSKINNMGKKKLKLGDKMKLNNNNKKNLNIDNFKGFKFNFYKGNTMFIKTSNNKKLEIKNNNIRLNTNPNETTKKKSIKHRNYLNLSGKELSLDAQKPNKSMRENKNKISNKKILLNELIK